MSHKFRSVGCAWQDNVYTVRTIEDGSCLFHALLNSTDTVYQTAKSEDDKKAIAYRFRLELLKYLSEPNPEYSSDEKVRQTLYRTYFDCTPEEINLDYDDDNRAMRIQGQNIQTFLEVTKLVPVSTPPKLPNLTRYVIDGRQTTKQDYNKPSVALSKLLKSFRESNSEEFYLQHLKYWKSDEPNISSDLYDDLDQVAKISSVAYEILQTYNQKSRSYRIEVNTHNRQFVRDNPTIVDLRPYLNTLFDTSIYTDLPSNCLFLTGSQGRRAYNCLVAKGSDFDENRYGLPKIMQRLANLKDFVGFGDALDFLTIIGVNILLLEETKTGLVFNTFFEGSYDNYVVINFRDGNHFETVGVQDRDGLQTIFDKNHPLITGAIRRGTTPDQDDRDDLQLLRRKKVSGTFSILPASPGRR